MCLRCLAAARAAARERAERLIFRGIAGAIVGAALIAAGVVAASSLRARNSTAAAAAAPASDSASVVTPPADSTSISTESIVRPDSLATATMPAPAPAPVAAMPVESHRATEPTAPPLAPVLPRGESPLSEGITAVRGDSDVVVVTFDLPMTRTRRPEKFEQIVRATLAAVYGQAATDLLAKLPTGAIAAQGELLTELPARGVRIPVDGAWMIRLFPETRPGQEGPLVIRYRVRVTPIGG